MKSVVENGRLIIFLEGSINSQNSEQVNQLIQEILGQNPGLPLTFDTENLRYISSSGIRVLIRLRKSGYEDIIIQNVSPEVYDILEACGLTTLMDVRKRMRRVNVESRQVIGEGAFGTVYRLDGDTVVKVYRNGEASLPIIREEIARARLAFVSGMPTAIPFDIVQVGDQYGAIFEMIDARNCNDVLIDDPAAMDELIPRYAAFLKALHDTRIAPGALPAARDIYLENLAAFAPCLKPEVSARLRALLEAMPENWHLVHGDAQLKNVMISSGEFTLIDMDKICVGNPVFEFASLFASYVAFNEDDPDNAMRFFGITAEQSSRIYHDTLRAYLGNPDAATLKRAQAKISAAGYMRFLTILAIEQKDVQDTTKDLRIRRAAECLQALAFRLDDLAI